MTFALLSQSIKERDSKKIREEYKEMNKTMCKYHQSLRKCTTKITIETAKIKNRQKQKRKPKISTTGEDVEQLDFLYFAGGNVKGYQYFQKDLVDFL